MNTYVNASAHPEKRFVQSKGDGHDTQELGKQERKHAKLYTDEIPIEDTPPQ